MGVYCEDEVEEKVLRLNRPEEIFATDKDVAVGGESFPTGRYPSASVVSQSVCSKSCCVENYVRV